MVFFLLQFYPFFPNFYNFPPKSLFQSPTFLNFSPFFLFLPFHTSHSAPDSSGSLFTPSAAYHSNDRHYFNIHLHFLLSISHFHPSPGSSLFILYPFSSFFSNLPNTIHHQHHFSSLFSPPSSSYFPLPPFPPPPLLPALAVPRSTPLILSLSFFFCFFLYFFIC